MFKLKSWTLLAGLIGLLALIAFTLWDEIGVLLVLGVAFAVNWFSLERGAALVLRMHRARPPESHQRKLPRVASALCRNRANSTSHRGIRHSMYSMCRRLCF